MSGTRIWSTYFGIIAKITGSKHVPVVTDHLRPLDSLAGGTLFPPRHLPLPALHVVGR